MIAIRHNIIVTVIESKKREYYNVMLQSQDLLKRVGSKVYEILIYAEGAWINSNGEIQ